MLIDALPKWRRIPLLACLGLSSSLPLFLISSVLQAWLADSGVSLANISAFSILILPYTLKMLWAPLCDRINLWPLERQRGWMLHCQWLIAAGLFIMPTLDPLNAYREVFVCVAALATFSATLDININSYCINAIHEKNRPPSMAYFVTGYRIGCIIVGSGTLVLADHVGWVNAYHLMAMLVLLTIINTLVAPATATPQNKEARVPWRTLLASIRARLGKKQRALTVLALLLLINVGDAFTLSLGSTFLLRYVGLSLTQLALVNHMIGFGVVLLGTLFAAYLFGKTTLPRVLMIAVAIQIIGILGYITLAWHPQASLWQVGISVSLELFGEGMISATLVSYLMYFCDERWGATHYAMLSAVPQLCRTVIGPLAGHLVAAVGWVNYFSLGATVMIGVLTMLIWDDRSRLRGHLDVGRG